MRMLVWGLFCWLCTGHLAGSFFISTKRKAITTRDGTSEGSLRDILGTMNELMNFAFSFSKPLLGDSNKSKGNIATNFVCPSYKCSDTIEPQCRRSVYYLIRGQRCMGCDVDICKVERRKKKAREPLRRSNINRDGAIETKLSMNPINFEKRWLFTKNRNRERLDSNFLHPLGTAPPTSRLPPGSENSWITGSLF